MRTSDGNSWRFSEDVAELLHLALFVRDAAGLPVTYAADVPPGLEGKVPDRADAIDEADKAAAAEQWLGWWSAVITAEARLHDQNPPLESPARPFPEDMRQRAVDGLAQNRAVLAPVTPEPPDFAALDGAPELQRAVAATFHQGHRFVDKRRRDLLFHDRPAQLPWVLLSDTAERIARERGVPIQALHGQVQVFMVQGEWWTLHSPGVGLASVQAARHRDLAARLVTEVFTSALER